LKIVIHKGNMAKIKVVQQHMKVCSNMEKVLTPGTSNTRKAYLTEGIKKGHPQSEMPFLKYYCAGL